MTDYNGEDRRQVESPSVRTWERHLQSVLTALVLAGILWLGNTANGNAQNIVRLVEQIKNLQERVSELKGSVNDRFTGTDGRRMNLRLDKLEDEFHQHLKEHRG
jgi:hypothetical protein